MNGQFAIVIYHGNCADGFGAAWCFHHHRPGCQVFHAGHYHRPPPDVTDRVVYLVDFSYKRPVIEDMLKVAKRIVLIDHHKSALVDLAGLEHPRWETYTDLARSGAGLAWDYLTENLPRARGTPRPPLINHIEDRDLWRFALPGTREIQAAVFSYPYDFEVWDKLMEPGMIKQLRLEGVAIERKHHKDVAELVKVCRRRMRILDHDVPVASLPYTLTSDAGHLMAQGEPFAACYWDTEDARHFSLRSTDDGLDVSAVAMAFGGGGHRSAAGFHVPRDHPLALA